ncbi:zinc/iron permease [Candidatus Pacearchaeota archaeon]|nr:zinc/iron permease [Candidatus Pacearchaeota archaeon]
MVELSVFQWIAIFSIGAAIINGLGIFAIFKNKKWAEKSKNYLMCFAAGVLISVPLMFALPNALEKTPYAGAAALVGFLFMFFSNQVIRARTKKKSLAFGITAAEGIGIHSFVDGVVYSVMFSASVFIGFLAGIGLVVHEFAEGVIAFSLLIKSNVQKKKAAFYAFLIASLTTPIGAFVAYPFIRKLSGSNLGLALGFVTGVLIYLSASHLLPEAQRQTRKNKKHSVIAFLIGVLLALLIVLTKIL